METYSNAGHVEVFQVALKLTMNAGAQLVATTSKLLVPGTEILFIYCLSSLLLNFLSVSRSTILSLSC